MAKDDREVKSGVWIDGTLYTDADELEKAASAEQINYLAARGAISGSFKGLKKADESKAAKKGDK